MGWTEDRFDFFDDDIELFFRAICGDEVVGALGDVAGFVVALRTDFVAERPTMNAELTAWFEHPDSASRWRDCSAGAKRQVVDLNEIIAKLVASR